MLTIKQFFKAIDKTDIDEYTKNLVSDGVIDSIDIMSLISEIEAYYKKQLTANFIKSENFEDFEKIKIMLEEAGFICK
ncbi:acyl carrier protein [Campylobacter volucris]|uniref:acyl carrier protein n=1 Tax=Campylobacter volucris TaxID=1031542 RepID=UPI00189C5A6F|nr:acyl carrier protein [Campylobacter volucris]MBF7046658.1 acyl carrier protein [Campylobacter volucris]